MTSEPKRLTAEDAVRLLHDKQGNRTQKEFAATLDISEQYLSDIYRGRREIGPTVIHALGLVKIVEYERWSA